MAARPYPLFLSANFQLYMHLFLCGNFYEISIYTHPDCTGAAYLGMHYIYAGILDKPCDGSA